MHNRKYGPLIVIFLIIILLLVNVPVGSSLAGFDLLNPAEGGRLAFLPAVSRNSNGALPSPTPNPTMTLPPGQTGTPPPDPTATQTPGPSPSATQPGPTPSATVMPPTNAIIIDHNSVALFEHIPEQYLEAARGIRMVFMDRSVGYNIHEGLNCLTATSWSAAPASCRRDFYDADWNWKTFSEQDYLNNQVPSLILFEPDPVRYNRSNWIFQYHAGSWEELVEDFVQVQFPAYVSTNDVLSFQFSYLNIDFDSTIDGQVNPDGSYSPGFFDADPGNPDRWEISDIEALEAQYPNKLIIHWTTSLARNLGSQDGVNFNNQMRQYAVANDKILFDVADIEAHDPNGFACFDSRDGDCYCNSNGCEDYSASGQSCNWNDGQDVLAICQNYTTETLGGHLGAVSGGKISIVKAFWVLMARVAGWDGQIQ